MKSLLDNLKMTKAIGYDGSPIELGGLYFSVGNTIWQYRIVGIIDKYNVEYVLENLFDDFQWKPYTADDKVRKSQSHYFISYNLYAEHFNVFL